MPPVPPDGPPRRATDAPGVAPPAQSAPPSRAASRVLLPLAWGAWLLAALAPALLVSPYVAAPRLWLEREAAPASFVLAAALFVVAIWPFWPALAGRVPPPDRRSAAAWMGRSLAELGMLAALAAPFAMAAWAVADRPVAAGPSAAAAGGLAVFALGLRVAADGLGPGAARWLLFAALTACAGPVLLEYVGRETLGATFPRVLEASPMVGAMRLALEGWPEGGWPRVARLALWPGTGAALAAAGAAAWVRRGREAGLRP